MNNTDNWNDECNSEDEREISLVAENLEKEAAKEAAENKRKHHKYLLSSLDATEQQITTNICFMMFSKVKLCRSWR